MKLPIPSDWNGEDWNCLQIQWPASREYNAILMGFLSYLTRGRVWDETTGVIKSVQAVGWEIVNKNRLLPTCEGESGEIPSPGEEPCWKAYEGVCEDDCEGDMGCCITNLRWSVNGELEMLRCGEWEVVDGYVALPPQTTEETIKEAETPEQAAEWACKKAQAIVESFWSAANYALDHWGDVTGFISGMNNAAGATLNWNWVLFLQEFCFAADIIELDTYVANELTDANKTALICTLSKRLDGSNNDIGANQTEIINDVFGERWTALDNPVMFTFAGDLKQCYGREQWREITRNSAILYDGNCCPEVVAPILPEGTTWAHEYRFDIYASGWTLVGQGATRVDGQGVVSTVSANFQSISGVRKSAPSPQANSKLTFVRLEYDQWPTCLSPQVGSWAYHSPNVINKNGQYWGRSVIQFECDETIQQGEELQLGNATVYGPDPLPSGTSVLRRVIIAGTGQDLFPSDPQYTEG